MAEMRPAAEMKDSGIEYIGEIPCDWSIRRGKNVLTVLNRHVKEDDGTVTCFRDGEVTLRVNRRVEGFTNADKEIGYQGVEPGDLVVHGMDGFAGAIGISDSRGKMSPIIIVLDSSENKYYLMYYLRAMAFREVFLALSTGIRERSCDLRWNKLAVFPFILPSNNEQQAIADYLDDRCSKIDEIIDEATASIEEYKELKQAVIFEAVTKGLDKSVLMKESGVEWIGEIPITWNRTKISRCFDIIGSGTTPKSDNDEFYNGNINWLQSGDINGSIVTETKKHLTQEAFDEFSTLKMFESPFIAMAMYGASIANTSIVKVDACTNQACCVLSSAKTFVDLNYMFYVLLAAKNELLLHGRGGTQPNISQEIIKSLVVPIPPLDEQRIIADKVVSLVSKTDSLISEKQALISDLQAYKKSLIYEVVTGKRRVV